MNIIKEKIKKLKEDKNIVILAHYYVNGDIQEIADYTGDSFYLSKLANTLENNIIVYCGVSFMGESACLLNPEKSILMPDMNADCPMAHMVLKEQVDEMRKKYDDLAVVCYINSTVEIKSWSDVVVTSSNAVKIVKNLPNKNILFIPDRNLGEYISNQVKDKNFLFVEGYCPIHENIKEDEILELKNKYKSAKVLAHPECRKEILKYADYIGSTTGIIEYAKNSDSNEFIILTEEGIRYELEKENKDKKFYFTKTIPLCPDMKLITLEKVLEVMEKETNKMEVCEEVGKQAKHTLERMMELVK